MIEFKNIYKSYTDGQYVLNDLNFCCEAGEITVIIGPSGCGKTTTMKLINRLISPTKGEIFINDENISNVNPVELRRKIGYVIQDIGLFPHMTIEQNVSVVPKLLKWNADKISKRVSELLSMVGLDPDIYRERYPSELSGGQQQRIGVIRALAAEPSIILMDEPFSALDPISREQLQEELNRLQEEIQKTIIFVTHDMDEALKIADKIVLMKDGVVVQHATPEEILRRPADEFVKEFIGRSRLKEHNEVPEVGEVMAKNVATISKNRGMAFAMNMMESRSVDSLVVVNRQMQTLGYVTVFDVTNAFEDEDILVKDIMKPFTNIIERDMLLNDAIHLLDQSKLSYIPVVDADEKLLGLLTRGSVVGHLKDAYPFDGSRGA